MRNGIGGWIGRLLPQKEKTVNREVDFTLPEVEERVSDFESGLEKLKLSEPGGVTSIVLSASGSDEVLKIYDNTPPTEGEIQLAKRNIQRLIEKVYSEVPLEERGHIQFFVRVPVGAHSVRAEILSREITPIIEAAANKRNQFAKIKRITDRDIQPIDPNSPYAMYVREKFPTEVGDTHQLNTLAGLGLSEEMSLAILGGRGIINKAFKAEHAAFLERTRRSRDTLLDQVKSEFSNSVLTSANAKSRAVCISLVSPDIYNAINQLDAQDKKYTHTTFFAMASKVFENVYAVLKKKNVVPVKPAAKPIQAAVPVVLSAEERIMPQEEQELAPLEIPVLAPAAPRKKRRAAATPRPKKVSTASELPGARKLKYGEEVDDAMGWYLGGATAVAIGAGLMGSGANETERNTTPVADERVVESPSIAPEVQTEQAELQTSFLIQSKKAEKGDGLIHLLKSAIVYFDAKLEADEQYKGVHKLIPGLEDISISNDRELSNFIEQKIVGPAGALSFSINGESHSSPIRPGSYVLMRNTGIWFHFPDNEKKAPVLLVDSSGNANPIAGVSIQ